MFLISLKEHYFQCLYYNLVDIDSVWKPQLLRSLQLVLQIATLNIKFTDVFTNNTGALKQLWNIIKNKVQMYVKCKINIHTMYLLFAQLLNDERTWF